MADWLDTGYEANRRLIQQQAKEQEERDRQRKFPRRFWLPKDSSAKVVFLDDSPVCTWEYNLNINGKWGNFFTCLRAVNGTDPFAAYKDRIQMSRSYMGFLTIIDCSEWTSKEGKVFRNTRKILPMTSGMMAKVDKWKQQRGSLVGSMFLVNRTNKDKAERVGDDWGFYEKIDLSTLTTADGKPVDITPVDYREYLLPRPTEEIEAMLRNIVGEVATPTATDVPGYTPDTTSEIPF